MRLLLDENLPKRLKNDFPDHQVYTVADKLWTAKKNGELLKLMLENDFAAMMTFDKNLQHQQNFERFPITVFVLSAPNNTYANLKPLAEKINQILNTSLMRPGENILYALHRDLTFRSKYFIPDCTDSK
jgi:predicted nuclease of predicted toxin-antitoxin system